MSARVRAQHVIVIGVSALLLSGCAGGGSPDGSTPAPKESPADTAQVLLQRCSEGLAELSGLQWEIQRTQRSYTKPSGTLGIISDPELVAQFRTGTEELAAQLGMRSDQGFEAKGLAAAVQAGVAQARGPLSVGAEGAYLRETCGREMLTHGALTQADLDRLSAPTESPAPLVRRSIPAVAPQAATPAEKACSERLRALYVQFLEGRIKPEQFAELAENPVDAQIIVESYEALESGEISNADVSVLREMGCIEAY